MKLIYTIISLSFFISISIAQTEWFKYPDSPVLEGNPGEWDNFIAFTCVIYEDTIYKMWYSGCTDFNVNCQIGYAESYDGIIWTRHPDPVFTPGDPGKFDAGILGGFINGVIYDEG